MMEEMTALRLLLLFHRYPRYGLCAVYYDMSDLLHVRVCIQSPRGDIRRGRRVPYIRSTEMSRRLNRNPLRCPATTHVLCFLLESMMNSIQTYLGQASGNSVVYFSRCVLPTMMPYCTTITIPQSPLACERTIAPVISCQKLPSTPCL